MFPAFPPHVTWGVPLHFDFHQNLHLHWSLHLHLRLHCSLHLPFYRHLHPHLHVHLHSYPTPHHHYRPHLRLCMHTYVYSKPLQPHLRACSPPILHFTHAPNPFPGPVWRVEEVCSLAIRCFVQRPFGGQTHLACAAVYTPFGWPPHAHPCLCRWWPCSSMHRCLGAASLPTPPCTV